MKRPPFLATYVAVAVLAALGAYIYFVESKREDKPEKAKEKVFALDKAKVLGLTLSAEGQEEVELVRDKDGWRMTAPVAVAADAAEADALVSSLQTLEMDEVVAASPPDLAEIGRASCRERVSYSV